MKLSYLRQRKNINRVTDVEIDFSKVIKGEILVVQNISLLLMLIPNTILDFKYKKVWMALILPFFLEGIILLALKMTTVEMFVSGLLMGILFIVISYLTKGSIGMGDGYIICVIGCLAGGYRTIVIVTAAMFISAIVAIVLMVIFKWGRKRTIPFVPFLLLATILNILSM